MTYLCFAFYGNNKTGISGINNMVDSAVELLEYRDAIPIITRQIYSEPNLKTDKWVSKHIGQQLSTAFKAFK